MTLKWMLGGAAAGALAALLVWFVGASEDGEEGVARSRVETERVEAASESRGRDELARGDVTSIERAPTVGSSATIDSDFGVVLLGRVVDESGAPVANAEVGLEDERARTTLTATSASGAWSQFDTTPGAYDLRVRARGFVDADESFVVPLTPTYAHATVLVRSLALPVRIEHGDGRLFDFDEQLPALADRIGVAVTRERPGATIGRHGRNKGEPCARLGLRDGALPSRVPADLGDRYCGWLELNAAPPLWVSLTYGNAVIETRALVGDESELVFTVDESKLREQHGTVRVRLVSARTGELLTTRVVLQDFNSWIDLEPAIDGDTLLFRDVPPGELQLECRDRAIEAFDRKVRVRPSERVDLGTIVLGEPALFEVHTVDENGAPLRMNVSTARTELLGGPEDAWIALTSDASETGVSSITAHALGTTLVTAGGNAGRARVGVVVDTSVVNPLVLRVPLGAEVVFDPSSDVSETKFTITNTSGVMLYSYLPMRACLSPGTYTWTARTDDRELARGTFDVANEPQTVRIEVPR